MKKISKRRLLVLTIIVVALSFLMAKLLATNNIEKIELDADYDLQITEIGAYSGPYMEDGTDEDVSDVMMITVKNNGKQAVQYGEITMTSEDGETALFKFSTLEADQEMTVLESTRKPYRNKDEYNVATAANVAYFRKNLSTYAGQLQIQPLGGGLNVINISQHDIDGEIIIYFKNLKDDRLMGGITYRGRITDGLKAGEVKQLMSQHFTEENTKVMFITINGE